MLTRVVMGSRGGGGVWGKKAASCNKGRTQRQIVSAWLKLQPKVSASVSLYTAGFYKPGRWAFHGSGRGCSGHCTAVEPVVRLSVQSCVSIPLA